MTILGLLNIKGGVGKSTLAANLAVGIHDLGISVALVDCDPQRDAIEPVQRVEPAIEVANPITQSSIAETIKTLKTLHQIVVVDTPGKSGEAVKALCRVADIVLVPLQPSKRDLRGTGQTLKYIRVAQKNRNGKPRAIVLFNFTRKRDIAARLFRKQLQPLGVLIANTQLRRLDATRDAQIVLRSRDRTDRAAAAEWKRLLHEILEFSKTVANARAGNE